MLALGLGRQQNDLVNGRLRDQAPHVAHLVRVSQGKVGIRVRVRVPRVRVRVRVGLVGT